VRSSGGLAGLIAIAAALSVAGCGGSGPSGHGEASKPPQQIVMDAASNLLKVRSFQLTGTAVLSGEHGSVSVDYQRPAALRFEITTPHGGTATAIIVGDVAYLNADKTFYVQQGASGSAAALLAGRWLKLPSTIPGLGSLTSQFQPATLSHCLTVGHGTLSHGGTANVGARAAVVVVDAGEKPGTTPGKLYVAAQGPPLPLRIESTGATRAGGVPDPHCGGTSGIHDSGTDVTFTSFNRGLRIAAPAGAISIPGVG
jgi:hypothetical protein